MYFIFVLVFLFEHCIFSSCVTNFTNVFLSGKVSQVLIAAFENEMSNNNDITLLDVGTGLKKNASLTNLPSK